MTKRIFACLICVACLFAAISLPAFAKTDAIVRGDVNCDGQRTAIDYFILKRYVLGTHALSEDALLRADLDGDTKINAKDYMLLKRTVLGSFALDEPSADDTDDTQTATVTLSIVLKNEAGKELAVLENVLPLDDALFAQVIEDYLASHPTVSEDELLENKQALQEITKLLLQAYLDALDTE